MIEGSDNPAVGTTRGGWLGKYNEAVIPGGALAGISYSKAPKEGEGRWQRSGGQGNMVVREPRLVCAAANRLPDPITSALSKAELS